MYCRVEGGARCPSCMYSLKLSQETSAGVPSAWGTEVMVLCVP